MKEIANMLETNPETVRRWIRSGKLKATQKSRKSGNYVTEETLKEFIASTPKYSKNKKSLAVLGVTAGVLFAEFLKPKKKINKQEQKSILKANIKELEQSIKSKKEIINQLSKELEKETRAAEILKGKLKMLK